MYYVIILIWLILHRLSNGRLNDSEKPIIYSDVCHLHKTANEFANKLDGGDDKEIGIELLHAWVKDLLGKRFHIIYYVR